MKIVKEHMGLPTDTTAFRGVEAFLSGLQLPLKDAVTVSEEEHRKLSKSMRELESHVVSNLLPFLDDDFVCKAKLNSSYYLCANINKGRIELYILDYSNSEQDPQRKKTVDIALTKFIIKTESQILYNLQRSAERTVQNEQELLNAKEEQEKFYEVFH